MLAGALIQVFTGVPAAWGVFQGAVCEGYDLSEHMGSMIFSCVICSFGIGCIFGGLLQDKKGPKAAAILGTALLSFGFIVCGFLPKENPFLMYLLFSVPTGLGTALLYPAVMACAQKWYAEKKGFATGVIGGATGLSGAVLTLLGTWLIGAFGIRFALVCLGAIMALICGAACIVLENPNSYTKKQGNVTSSLSSTKTLRNAAILINSETKTTADKNKSKDFTIAQVFKTKQYYLLTAAVCFANPSMILFSPLIVQIAQNRGLGANVALSCVAVGSVFSAIGRLSMPWLSDKKGRKNVFILLFSFLFFGSITFTFAKGIWVLFIYCALAFCYSGQAAVLPATVTDLYGQKNTGLYYGFVALGMSVGSILFPLLASMWQGSEGARHIIAIVATFSGLVCVLFLSHTKKGKRL